MASFYRRPHDCAGMSGLDLLLCSNLDKRRAMEQSSQVAERLDTLDAVQRDTIARMFKSDFMEVCSKVHPVVPALIFVPVSLWLMSVSVADFGWSSLAPALLLGVLIWTFVEYTLHRFLFHIEPRGPVTRMIYFNLHGVHHHYPDDYYRLVMVPVVSIPLALAFYSMFAATLPVWAVDGAFAGMVLGYLGYDYSHFATHFVRPPKHPLLRPVADIMMAQRKRHMRHHFGNHECGFGVSTGFWDHVFRTVDPKSG